HEIVAVHVEVADLAERVGEPAKLIVEADARPRGEDILEGAPRRAQTTLRDAHLMDAVRIEPLPGAWLLSLHGFELLAQMMVGKLDYRLRPARERGGPGRRLRRGARRPRR